MLKSPLPRRRVYSGSYVDSERPSGSPSSYSSCESIDEVVEQFRGYRRRVRDMVNSLSDLDEATVINQGTVDSRQPQLGFHSIHGVNVNIMKSRIAKRTQSFCKGLAFSNRPIGINENVCLRLVEVATNWSGVLRFGVTNIDPETYRNIPVPKFACPDLTSKEGVWAKALPERYSVEGHILHFYVNNDGELFYGINGTQKGVFLMGINTNLPLWIIVDIYGNSIAVEFIDTTSADHQRNIRSRSERPTSTRFVGLVPTPIDSTVDSSTNNLSNNALQNHTPVVQIYDPIKFHRVTGRHMELTLQRTLATRSENEYAQGYLFTERPIQNNEKLIIQIMGVQPLYSGGLAFGVTCCDPNTLRTQDLPDDSSELIEMPDYWVSIKDIALQPRLSSVLSFWITDKGEVMFERDNAGARVVLHVDNSLQLYMFFDVYGSTQSIKLLGVTPANRAPPRVATRVALPPANNRQTLVIPQTTTPRSLNEEEEARRSRPSVPPRNPPVDLLTGPPLQPTPIISSSSSSNLRPPPIIPRNTHSAPSSSAILLPAPPARPPPPTPVVPHTYQGTVIGYSNNAVQVKQPQVAATLPPAMPAPKRPTPPGASTLPSGKPTDESEDEECTICMAAAIDSVIYKCGHMCMCYSCATATFKSTGLCPLCREKISDVIRIYKP